MAKSLLNELNRKKTMRHSDNLDPRLFKPHADAQYVLEYLFSEVFSHQPPEISRYLMASAILDRFCGPLCDAICMPERRLGIYQKADADKNDARACGG